MCVLCEFMSTMCTKRPTESWENRGSCGCEPPAVGAGHRTGSSRKAVSAASFCAIFPAPQYTFSIS